MKTCNKDKLKIAYMMHAGEVSTYGGFPHHVEHAIYGLKQLGHKVDFYFLRNVATSNEDYINGKIQNYEDGNLVIEGQVTKTLDKGIGTGHYFHVNFGWVCPSTPIKTLENKKRLKAKLEKYDVVFWHTPFWFKQKSMLADTDWPMLLDLKKPVNIAFHHDANIRGNAAWMLHVDKYFDRIITVHPASYNACSVFETPRTMIFNPQFIDYDLDHSGFDNNTFFSLQYWKSSKHVDDLLRAIPHYKYDSDFVLAGRGMEFSYMTSQDKIKDKYIGNTKDDPDIAKKFIGIPIIKAAQSCGAEFPLWITSAERDDYLSRSKFFVDTAWYTINLELDAHFSRTLVEAMIHGVVPIGRNLGLSNNLEGVGTIFKPDENYLMIPYDTTPKQFAKYLNRAHNIPRKDYEYMVARNYDLLHHFDVMKVAKQYVDVIGGHPTGYYHKYETGGTRVSKKLQRRADDQWYGTPGVARTFNFKKEKKDGFFF